PAQRHVCRLGLRRLVPQGPQHLRCPGLCRLAPHPAPPAAPALPAPRAARRGQGCSAQRRRPLRPAVDARHARRGRRTRRHAQAVAGRCARRRHGLLL
ncbi:hypothetical protein GGH95_004682, partial [Coemansia sp. RSA 1836]